MMGKLAKVMRWASIFADAGSSACTRESVAFTYRRVWNISTSQVKNRSISAEPRLVTEGTFCKPGNAVHCFFQRPGDGHHHLVNGHNAVIHTDQNSREVR